MKNKMELFQKVERGELTAEDAVLMLEQWQDAPDLKAEDTPFTPDAVLEPEPPVHPEPEWRHYEQLTHWWILPFAIGVLTTVMGGVWMYMGWNGGDLLFGFWLAWIPFVLGVFLMALSYRARASHWIFIKIRQKPGRRPGVVHLSFPLPFGLVKWVNKKYGHHFPSEVRGVDLDDLMDSIESSVTRENPIYVWVDDDDEDHEQVEIWIGRGVE